MVHHYLIRRYCYSTLQWCNTGSYYSQHSYYYIRNITTLPYKDCRVGGPAQTKLFTKSWKNLKGTAWKIRNFTIQNEDYIEIQFSIQISPKFKIVKYGVDFDSTGCPKTRTTFVQSCVSYTKLQNLIKISIVLLSSSYVDNSTIWWHSVPGGF